MRIVLADDQSRVRAALRLLIEQEPALRVEAEASDAEGLMRVSETVQPDAVLLDWELPGLDRDGAIKALKVSNAAVRLVVLSSRPEARAAALRAGADCFVSKGDPPESLLAALQALRDGGGRCSSASGTTTKCFENRD